MNPTKRMLCKALHRAKERDDRKEVARLRVSLLTAAWRAQDAPEEPPLGQPPMTAVMIREWGEAYGGVEV